MSGEFITKSFQAKSVLTEPSERKRYDLWLDSGIAMSFKQWQGLKDAVHTSMHWATPKLAGRMLNNGESQSVEEEILQHLHNVEEARGGGEGEGEGEGEPPRDEEERPNEEPREEAVRGEGEEGEARAEDPAPDEEITYPPTNFTELGLRVESPDPEWGWDRPEEEIRAEALARYKAVREEDKGKDDGLPKINEVKIRVVNFLTG